MSVERLRQRAESDAKSSGCYLNPDPEILLDLLDGLKRNEERYGYPSCPCRLASGTFEDDRDILCPCDYRDPDVQEYGTCYCSLYVRKDVFEGKKPIQQIPERRPANKQAKAYVESSESPSTAQAKASVKPPTETLGNRLWYCKQCGYTCFREAPPYICPICKAKREMFAEIALDIKIQG
jgi:ferredoxin-thioredoxin reductase catalytic subunit